MRVTGNLPYTYMVECCASSWARNYYAYIRSLSSLISTNLSRRWTSNERILHVCEQSFQFVLHLGA